MDLDVLMHYCRCQYQLYEIPLRIYRHGKLVCCLDRSALGKYDEDRDALILRDTVPERGSSVRFSIQASLLLEGAVFDKASDLFIYVGLARGVQITKPIVRRYLKNMGLPDDLIFEDDVERFLVYMNELPVVAPGLFVVFLSALNTFVNGEIIEPGSIFARNVVGQADTNVQTQMLAQREARYFGNGPDNANFIKAEARFLFYVRNGMVRELQDFIRACSGFELGGGAENPDAWRMVKDHAIVGVALVSRAAIEAGLPSLEASQLCDLYIQKAELCQDAKTLNSVRLDMLIDYTERVRELKVHRTDNQTVNRVNQYILNHIEENLSLAGLAQRFDISKNYLCSVFKQEIGMSLTEYIQYNKINVAKQLLRYTDKSLIEIANYLGFCSQSYFQQVFKKQTGLTPTAYRSQAGQ